MSVHLKPLSDDEQMLTRDATYGLPKFNKHEQQWEERDIPLQYSHAERPNFRVCPVVRPSRTLNSRDTDADASGVSTRRRIAVAVRFLC